jgi:hypothetical protein
VGRRLGHGQDLAASLGVGERGAELDLDDAAAGGTEDLPAKHRDGARSALSEGPTAAEVDVGASTALPDGTLHRPALSYA